MTSTNCLIFALLLHTTCLHLAWAVSMNVKSKRVDDASTIGVSATTPVVVTETTKIGQYVYFPQTLVQIGSSGGLFLSFQTDADELHDDGWTGRQMFSANNGRSWEEISTPLSPWLAKSCLPIDAVDIDQATHHSFTCFSYCTRRAGDELESPSGYSAHLRGQIYKYHILSRSVTQSGIMNASVTGFPSPLNVWGNDTYTMVTDGNPISLNMGSNMNGVDNVDALAAGDVYMMILYGKYQGDAKYTAPVVTTSDGGHTWDYRSAIEAVPSGVCDNPSEHDCTWVPTSASTPSKRGASTLFCVFRSVGTNGSLCGTTSEDAGHTWKPLQPLTNGAPGPSDPYGVEPKVKMLANGKLVVTSGRPGLWTWVASDATQPLFTSWSGFNIAAHHNQMIHDDGLKFASDLPVASGAGATTSYMGVAVVGDNAVVITYDRLANGWSPAQYPQNRSAIFAVQLTIE